MEEVNMVNETNREKVGKGTVRITITAKGTLKFKQELVDKIYELLMEEDFTMAASKPGNGLTFQSSLPPSEVW